MKLKYTTKLFIIVNTIAVALRTAQIFLLTEDKTGFLKPGLSVINIIIAVFTVLCIAAMFSNSSQAVRQPEKLNCCGLPSAIAAGMTALCYLGSGIAAVVAKSVGWKIVLLMSVLAAVMCIWLMLAALKVVEIKKGIMLLPLPYWLIVFVLSYLFYTERSLRVRTVYETFAVSFFILFTVVLGKAVSGVNPEKNFRRIYPLGLTACTLCTVSVLPELIATLSGFAEKVSDSPVMPLTLVAGAVFSGFFTINTFKKSNTVHPGKKKKTEQEARLRHEAAEPVSDSAEPDNTNI